MTTEPRRASTSLALYGRWIPAQRGFLRHSFWRFWIAREFFMVRPSSFSGRRCAVVDVGAEPSLRVRSRARTGPAPLVRNRPEFAGYGENTEIADQASRSY